MVAAGYRQLEENDGVRKFYFMKHIINLKKIIINVK
jgi:hypothetical protein